MFSQKVINCKTASSRALKLCAKSNDVCLLSYKDLHEMAGRAKVSDMNTLVDSL